MMQNADSTQAKVRDELLYMLLHTVRQAEYAWGCVSNDDKLDSVLLETVERATTALEAYMNSHQIVFDSDGFMDAYKASVSSDD